MATLVNGQRIEDAEISAEIERLRAEHDRVFHDLSNSHRAAQLKKWATENVVERVLLSQEAKHGTVDDVIARATADVRTVNDDELRKLYQENPGRFRTPDLARASQIVLHVTPDRSREQALSEIQEIEEFLKLGRPFEELAAQYSDCPDNDGDLGLFPRGEMVEEFENAVFSLGVGETSGIIETPFGFHIAKLHEKRDGHVRPFNEVKEILREERTQELKESLLDAFLDNLRAKATIIETNDSL